MFLMTLQKVTARWAIIATVALFTLGASMQNQLDQNTENLIKQALQKHFGKSLFTIEYLDVQKVNWPTSALGCEEPGHSYLQVITPGHKVRLKVDGRGLIVHTSQHTAKLCNTKKPVAKVTPTKISKGMSDQIKAIQLARKQLIAKLKEENSEVRLRDVKSITYTEAKQKCVASSTLKGLSKEATYFYVSLELEKQLFNFISDGVEVMEC